jgi:glutathione peroxidase
MIYKYSINIYIILIMLTFFEKAEAKYEELFHQLKINSIDGGSLDLTKYENKTILLVNVASKCGFTKQYSELQTLYDEYRNKGFTVIGVPSNQFGGQESGTNSEIKKFCEVNFNITFPLTDKIKVKGDEAHPLYLWAKKNYGSSAVPKWNFHKILINKDGQIHKTFNSFTKPMSKNIIKEIESIL